MGLKTRSRNGCFTCRRRKKKCDESLYPDCKNCLANGLLCTWPVHVVELHKEIELVEEKEAVSAAKSQANMVVATPSIGRSYMENYPSVIRTEANGYECSELRYSQEGRISKPETKGRNYFLERIAMQQDCVDDKFEGDSISKKSSTGRTNDIKSRIAQQLDVADGGI